MKTGALADVPCLPAGAAVRGKRHRRVDLAQAVCREPRRLGARTVGLGESRDLGDPLPHSQSFALNRSVQRGTDKSLHCTEDS